MPLPKRSVSITPRATATSTARKPKMSLRATVRFTSGSATRGKANAENAAATTIRPAIRR